MVRKVEWSRRFMAELKEIIIFLRENTSENVVDDFKLKLEQKIVKIAEYPEAGRKAGKRKSVRFVNFYKRYHIFYRISGSTLFISAIFDTKQDPTKRPF